MRLLSWPRIKINFKQLFQQKNLQNLKWKLFSEFSLLSSLFFLNPEKKFRVKMKTKAKLQFFNAQNVKHENFYDFSSSFTLFGTASIIFIHHVNICCQVDMHFVWDKKQSQNSNRGNWQHKLFIAHTSTISFQIFLSAFFIPFTHLFNVCGAERWYQIHENKHTEHQSPKLILCKFSIKNSGNTHFSLAFDNKTHKN